jgi:hypothetical protein
LTPPIKIQRNTGLRIPKRKAERIIAAYVSGMSVRGICRAFGTNWSAVAALIRNRPEMVQKARTEAQETWATLAALGTAELLARQKNMTMQSLVTTVGIATDKATLLEDTGEQAPEPPEEPASVSWAEYLEAAGALS